MAITLGIRALALVLLACTAATALTKDETKCVLALNKDGAAVGQQQGKENLACVKAEGKEQLTGTAQACLTADAKGLVAAKMQKTTTDEQKHCGDAPDFAYTSAGTVNAVSRQAEIDLVADVFGNDLDVAVVSCETDAKACKCQTTVLNRVEKIAKAERSAFLKCKKTALKTADGAEDIAACIVDVAATGSIAAARQPGGKLAKEVVKLGGEIAKKCDTPMVTSGAFPGACTGLSGDSLRDCLDGRLGCRLCQSLRAMDGLVVDCDAFDDGVVNASCTDPVCVPGSMAACYTGPPGTAGVGACTAGAQVCNASGTGYGSCAGEVVPTADVCGNALDDDCDGAIDDGCICIPGSMAACYTGPPGTAGVGACTAGAQVCDANGTGYGSCTGEIVPTADVCGNGLDDDCDGAIDDGCICIPGSTAPCYTGPPGTAGVGACTAGAQVCDANGTGYGSCTGQIVPTADVCGNGLDDDCDGTIDEGCLGDRAWNDLNGNGLQDLGEPGLAGAVFLLRTSSGALVAIAVSGASGSYSFSVPAGSYYLEVIAPSGYVLTQNDVGSNDTIDSDFDDETAATPVFSFSGSTSNIDCGLHTP